MSCIVRPEAYFHRGQLWFGRELVLGPDGKIEEIRPALGASDGTLLSPAFVNAHSHLEYAPANGQLPLTEGYVPWVRALVARKRAEAPEDVLATCRNAAKANRVAGVGYVHEHSDRPGAALALAQEGIAATVFAEVLSIGRDPEVVWTVALERDLPLAPHALHTVHAELLQRIAQSGKRCSIHVAESPAERELFATGEGALSELVSGFALPTGTTPVEYALSLGLGRPGVQWVHVCEVAEGEWDRIAAAGVSIAHCPRSNAALACRPFGLRRALDAGIPVGLGLDSQASSGPVSMVEEMAAALAASPVTAEEVWSVATEEGAKSLGLEGWSIEVGHRVPLIAFPFASLNEIIHNRPVPTWVLGPFRDFTMISV